MQQDAAAWFAVAVSLLTLGWSVYYARRKADSDVVAKIFTRLDSQDHRIVKLESEVKHLPDKDSQHRIELTLHDVTGQLDVMAARLEPIAAISTRLQEFLLEQAKR